MFILSSSFCTNPSSLSTILFIKELIKIVSIAIPAILILLLTIDFAKAVVSNEEEKMKEAQSYAIKRIVFAAVIFFLPIVIDTAFSLLGDIGVSYLDCYNNANKEHIDALIKEQKANEKQESPRKAAKEYNNSSNTTSNSSSTNKSNSSSSSTNKSTNTSSSTSKKSKSTSSNESSLLKKAKSYSKYHLLKTLNVKRSASIKPVGNNFVSQSFVVAGNYYAVMVVTRGNNSTMISVHNKNTGTRVNKIYSNFNHANGSMYNPYNDTIYVAHSYGTFRYSSFSAKNINSVKKVNPKKHWTSRGQSAMAYDSTTRKYIITNGRSFYVYSNLEGKKEKTITRKVTAGLRQDIGAHNGIIYACRANGGNFVDLYRESDGKYLGTYKLNVSGEIESIDYYGSGDKFAVLVYYTGTADDKIYTVDMPIPK